MAGLVRLKLVFVLLLHLACVVSPSFSQKSADQDDAPATQIEDEVRFLLREVQDLRNLITNQEKQLAEQQQQLNLLLGGLQSTATSAKQLATGSISKQVVDNMEKKLVGKLKGVVTTTVNEKLKSQENTTKALINARINDRLKSLDKDLGNKIEMKVRSELSKLDNVLQKKIQEADERKLKSKPSRTCQELMSSDPSLESGMYFIDPDGWNTGDPPIRVRCLKSGGTEVLHDSMEKIKVRSCYEAGCYSRSVNYSDATMRQIKALILLSASCDQRFRYDCMSAPLKSGWWNDRNGHKRFYWSGRENSIHTCSCGEKNGCLYPNEKCNCDASVNTALHDEGLISNKDHLPVTRLNLGRTTGSQSSGEHTLGPLHCSGSYQSSANALPASCADLWKSGVTLNGFYQVKAHDGAIVTVFCDMTKLPEENGQQMVIGTNDVKTKQVYFTVVRITEFRKHAAIPFETAILNIGNAMDLKTGKFTAPKKGIYYFALTLCSNNNAWAQIYRNNDVIVTADTSNDNDDDHAASAVATLQLSAGDVVYALLKGGNAIGRAKEHNTHFTGYLIQELY